MKQLMMLGIACLAGFSLAPSLAADEKCKEVSGHFTGTSITAPNEPIGRYLGSTNGGLQAVASGYPTSITPQPDGSVQVTSNDVMVVGPQDTLNLTCTTTAVPILGAPVGTVNLATTYTVTGGTGQYAGATGTIKVTGIGFNQFGPNAGPGSTYFVSTYSGNVCRSK